MPSETREWADKYFPRFQELPDGLHVYMLVSIMSKTLCEGFKAHYYFGLSNSDPVRAAAALAKALRPERNVEGRRWLEDVRAMIAKQDGNVWESAQLELQAQMARSAESDIGEMLPSEVWEGGWRKELAKIFGDAVVAFQKMHRQRARWFVGGCRGLSTMNTC